MAVPAGHPAMAMSPQMRHRSVCAPPGPPAGGVQHMPGAAGGYPSGGQPPKRLGPAQSAAQLQAKPQPPQMQQREQLRQQAKLVVQQQPQLQPQQHHAMPHGSPQAKPQQMVQGQKAMVRCGSTPQPTIKQKPVSVTDLLKNREQLKSLVIGVYNAVAGSKGLDINGLQRFRSMLSQKLRIPEAVFGDLMADYIRFDFDGKGVLNVNEAYGLVKFHLWEHWKKSAGFAAHFNIPFKSLQEAGFSVHEELGGGSQAVVRLCTDNNGSERCVKCYRKDTMDVGGVTELVEEFEAMQLLGCKRIAQTFEVFQDTDFFYMVNEVYYGGDFLTLTERAKAQGVCLTENWWRKLVKQCLRGLEFMHKNAMIHCDIKEANLMLKSQNYNQPEVVIVDFGISKAMGAAETGRVGGTPGYMPPETLELQKWFPGGDVFSLGVVMFQMTTDNIPNNGHVTGPHTSGLFVQGCMTFDDITRATMTRVPPLHLMPQEYPNFMLFTKRCLEKQMQTRPRAPLALEDPWFTEATEEKSYGAPSEMSRFPRPSEPLESAHPLASKGIVMPEASLDRAALQKGIGAPPSRAPRPTYAMGPSVYEKKRPTTLPE